MTFAYPAGGPYSYQAIVDLARRFCPTQLGVTSTKRDTGSDWHTAGYAVDFAAPYDHGPGSNQMAAAARWWIQLAPYLLELIHSAPTSAGGGEFLVKNGQLVSPEFYGWDVVNQHENHVHVAMTLQAAQALSSRLSAGSPTPTPVTSPGRVWGWDASNHDWGRGPMDMSAARSAGVNFFVHKATGCGVSEGRHYTDPYFAQALSRARSAGIPVLGSYHVVCPGTQVPVTDQVDHALSTVNNAVPWWREVPWVWQCDAEDWGTGVWPTPGDCKAFLDGVRDRTGHGWTVWYAPRRQFQNAPDIGHDLWVPDYHTTGTTLSDLYPGDGDRSWAPYASGRTPAILQFASDCHIGPQPDCDANAYRGTIEQLITRAGGRQMTDFTTADVNAWREARRVEALACGRDTVADSGTTPEKVAMWGRIAHELSVNTEYLAAMRTTAAPVVTLSPDQMTAVIDAVTKAVRAENASLLARLQVAEQAEADALKAA